MTTAPSCLTPHSILKKERKTKKRKIEEKNVLYATAYISAYIAQIFPHIFAHIKALLSAQTYICAYKGLLFAIVRGMVLYVFSQGRGNLNYFGSKRGAKSFMLAMKGYSSDHCRPHFTIVHCMSTVLYSPLLYSHDCTARTMRGVQRRALHCYRLDSSVKSCTVLPLYIALYITPLHCIHCSALHCTYCSALQCKV